MELYEDTSVRELSILRTPFHNARKRTSPKVKIVPYFPVVAERPPSFGSSGFLVAGGHIEAAAVEVDGVDEVLLIAEAACGGLDPLNP